MLISLVAKINELSHSQLAIDEPTLSASGCIKIGYGINIGVSNRRKREARRLERFHLPAATNGATFVNESLAGTCRVISWPAGRTPFYSMTS